MIARDSGSFSSTSVVRKNIGTVPKTSPGRNIAFTQTGWPWTAMVKRMPVSWRKAYSFLRNWTASSRSSPRAWL